MRLHIAVQDPQDFQTYLSILSSKCIQAGAELFQKAVNIFYRKTGVWRHQHPEVQVLESLGSIKHMFDTVHPACELRRYVTVPCMHLRIKQESLHNQSNIKKPTKKVSLG